MNNLKKMLTGIIAVMSVMTSAVSCSADKSQKAGPLVVTESTSSETTTITETTGNTDPTKPTESTTIAEDTKAPTTAQTTTPEETHNPPMFLTTTTQVTEPIQLGDPVDISNTEIVWLSDYDLNPELGKPRPVAVALFEDIFGGHIRYVQTSARDKYYTLSNMILSGEEVDMFEFEPEYFPKNVLSNQYQALDPYFRSMGFNTGIWNGMYDVIDSLEYRGEHYVIPYSLSNPSVLTYSRKLIRDYNLDDPYELYKQDKWDFNAFIKIMENYNKKTGKRAVNGSIGDMLIHSGGERIINYKNGKLINNINNASVRYAELLMQNMCRKSLYSTSWNEYYTTNTLFFAYDSWTLGTSNVMNPNMDLMVVPAPKPNKTNGKYIMCDFDAKMLVKNSTKGDAVATYIQCERIVATQPTYLQGAKEYALIPETDINGNIKSYITEEQYNALQEFVDTAEVTPVFEYGYGMNDRMSGAGGIMDVLANHYLTNSANETDWKNLRNLYYDTINGVIEEYK